jgi:3-isopropylmalate dehydratase small subunit
VYKRQPDEPAIFSSSSTRKSMDVECTRADERKISKIRGRVWYIPIDNIDTDMIFHNRHLTITDLLEMGKFAFGNLEGYEDFSSRVSEGDILVVGRNFGAGSSRQQAVDCFRSLGVCLIIAESFGAIYERNAINTGMPIVTYEKKDETFSDGDEIEVDLLSGEGRNLTRDADFNVSPLSEVQLDIYKRGGLLNKVCKE